jgi:integrase
MTRHRKSPQPKGLSDNIYWRNNGYHLYFVSPITKRQTSKVVLTGVPKSEMRDPDTIKRANDAARTHLETLATEGTIPRAEITVALAWTDFLKNKHNRRGERLKNSTRQDYQSIYDNYILGAFDPSHRPLAPRVKEPRRIERDPEKLPEEQRRRLTKRTQLGLATLTVNQLGERLYDEGHPGGATRLTLWREWLDTLAYRGDGQEPDRGERKVLGLISIKRKANVILVMKSFLSHCYRHDPRWTRTNLGSDLRVPLGRDPRFHIPDYDDLMRLLAVLDGQGAVFAELALYAGLRAGELVALDWDDIDYDDEVIHIRRNFTHGEMSDTTKGHRDRDVPLHDRLTRLLKQWRKDCPSDTMVFPATHIVAHGEGDGRVLVRVAKDGQRMSVDSFREKTWKPAVAKVGLEGTRLHDMRHAYIQWLVALNVNPLVIQAAAGHRDPKTTAAYLNQDPKLLQGVRDAFNAPRKTRRGKATEPAEPVYAAKEPAKKKVERPEKPAHAPGRGIVIKKR